ncbi:X8 domain [Musa troglodytarum]|uniref:X8 domain n=1 Tax=Musa troglodytarum TaxID=320322 RepID=A0A9E7IDE3_9LILI|nr:X8 domain [Musa troglodytarum]
MQCQTKDSGVLFPVIFPRESEKLLVTLAMRSGEWMVIYGVLLMVECYVVAAPGARLQQKAESTTPIPAFSPPEGNTTFIDGTTWCVARPGISQSDLQNALDWACGLGGADCSLVQPGAACYHPDTLLSHASYVFNSYYQQNGNSDIACYFGGTAAVVRRDPSYGSCKYLSSELPLCMQASLCFAIVSEELPLGDCGNLDPPMSKHQIRISIYCICSWLSRILVVRDLQTKANQSVYTKNSSLDGQMFHDWTSGQISVILFRRR